MKKNIRTLVAFVVVLLCAGASAQVSTFYGVQWSQWTTTDRTMKLDYDWVRGRFVAQYKYPGGMGPLNYATIDLNTKAVTHFATPGISGMETLLTVLPAGWGSSPQGTTFFGSSTTGKIYAISPTGTVSQFASGVSAGGAYCTVRWDDVGAFGNDLFYADEGTGEVWRINSAGTVTHVVNLMDGQNRARPEPMIVLGSNPRYGQLQNRLLVG